jgi:hypothetical protein
MKKISMSALVFAAAVGFVARPAFDQTLGTPQTAPPEKAPASSASTNAAVAAKLVGLCLDKVQRQSLQKACLAVAENFRRGGDPSADLDFAQTPQGGDIDVGGPWGTIVLRDAGASGVVKFLSDVNGRDPSVVVVPAQASTSHSPSRGGGRSRQRGF